MSKIAIDVVLLPPEEIMDLVISINKSSNQVIPLGKEDYIPHNSLCIAVAEEENVPQIIEILKDISQKFFPIKIEIKDLILSGGDRSSDWFKIEKNSELQHLHETVMDRLKKLLVFESSDIKIFYKERGETIEKIPTTFKNNYLNYAYDKYNPHMTLCCKESRWNKFPITYTAKRLALFHAGKSTTCRKILFETKLKEVKNEIN
jgi:2'-5' RNA ligase